MREDIDRFDTSDYPENNQFGLPRRNKKVIGLMKDECSGHVMIEFIGLRSKMYSIRIQDKQPVKKAKRVKTDVVKTRITFEDYRDRLFNKSIVNCQKNKIRSRKHVVRTEREEKIALSPYDDKRYVLDDATDTLPWGHFTIVEADFLLDGLMQVEARGEEEEEEEGEPITESEEEEGEAGGVGPALLKELDSRAGHIRSLDEPENEEPPSKRTRLTISPRR